MCHNYFYHRWMQCKTNRCTLWSSATTYPLPLSKLNCLVGVAYCRHKVWALETRRISETDSHHIKWWGMPKAYRAFTLDKWCRQPSMGFKNYFPPNHSNTLDIPLYSNSLGVWWHFCLGTATLNSWLISHILLHPILGLQIASFHRT